MPIVKLGIAGTHSTGKSTLLSKVEEMLVQMGLRVSRVASLAAAAREAGFPILHDHTFESTLWIMSRGISCELEASLAADVVLVDRPIMDALAYLFAALAHRDSRLSSCESEYLLELAKHHARTYTVICKTVLDPNIPLGPGRDQNMAFRKSVTSELDSVFKELSLEHRVVTSDPEFLTSLINDIASALPLSRTAEPRFSAEGQLAEQPSVQDACSAEGGS